MSQSPLSASIQHGFYHLDIQPGYQQVQLFFVQPSTNKKRADQSPPLDATVSKIASVPLAMDPFDTSFSWRTGLSQFLKQSIHQADLPLWITVPAVYSQTLQLPSSFSKDEIETALISEAEQLYLFKQSAPRVRWYRLPNDDLYYSALPEPFVLELKQTIASIQHVLVAIDLSDALFTEIGRILPVIENQPEATFHDAHQVLLMTSKTVSLAHLSRTGTLSALFQTPYPSQMESPLEDIAQWVQAHPYQGHEASPVMILNRVEGSLLEPKAIQALFTSRPEQSVVYYASQHHASQKNTLPEAINITLDMALGKRLYQQAYPSLQPHCRIAFYDTQLQFGETHPLSLTEARYRNLVRALLFFLNVATLMVLMGWGILLFVINQQGQARLTMLSHDVSDMARQSVAYRESMMLQHGLLHNILIQNAVIYTKSVLGDKVVTVALNPPSDAMSSSTQKHQQSVRLKLLTTSRIHTKEWHALEGVLHFDGEPNPKPQETQQETLRNPRYEYGLTLHPESLNMFSPQSTQSKKSPEGVTEEGQDGHSME